MVIHYETEQFKIGSCWLFMLVVHGGGSYKFKTFVFKVAIRVLCLKPAEDLSFRYTDGIFTGSKKKLA